MPLAALASLFGRPEYEPFRAAEPVPSLLVLVDM